MDESPLPKLCPHLTLNVRAAGDATGQQVIDGNLAAGG
jgi:hypothetical protein